MIDTTSRHARNAASPRTLSCKPRRGGLRHVWPPLAGMATVAVTVAACSTWSSMTSGSAPPAPAGTTGGSFTSRVKSFFSGGSGSLSRDVAAEANCPAVAYRQGAATWAVNSPGVENSAMGLRYQASFIQTARECIVTGGNLTIKVGVQGRIVIGPAGSPGTVNIPLRYALVRDGLHPKTLWTKLYTVPVTIPSSDLNVPWIHIQEEMTVPRPSPQELEAYVVYVGFDPQGAAKPKRPARRKTARAR